MNLRCPICGAQLNNEGKRCVCPQNHSFDVARQGYVNLLTVQQKIPPLSSFISLCQIPLKTLHFLYQIIIRILRIIIRLKVADSSIIIFTYRYIKRCSRLTHIKSHAHLININL